MQNARLTLRLGPLTLTQTLVLAGSLSLSACGSSDRSTIIECASPSGALKAVFWYEGGGGAAGWSQLSLTIMSSSVPTDHVDQYGETDGLVFRLANGSDLQLNWKNERLLWVGYPSAADVRLRVNTSVVRESEPINIQYGPVQSDRYGILPGGSSCAVNDKPVVAPPPRKLHQN